MLHVSVHNASLADVAWSAPAASRAPFVGAGSPVTVRLASPHITDHVPTLQHGRALDRV